jgi:diguanylate cyclase (GGDEF)-like protein
LAQAATLDALTGLPNRQAFLHAVDIACSSGDAGFVALFDIDGLDAINDRHGDATGDAVLRAFAAEAADLVRAGDSLSRISGSTFAVILPTDDIARAEKVAARLIAKFGGAARAMGNAIVLATASAGIAPWRDSAAETIRDAEGALLIAKSRDHDRFEMAGAARRRA